MGSKKKEKQGQDKKHYHRSPDGRSAEDKCRAAIKILIQQGKIDDFAEDPVFDEVGIDFVLFKSMIPRSIGSLKGCRASLHIQVKQGIGDKSKHEKRYPCIPFFSIPRLTTNDEVVAGALWDFFLRQFPEDHEFRA